jgi:hypothetical protein
MKGKYTLRVDNPYSDEIVKIASSNTIYLDDEYFKTYMGDSTNYQSY